MDGGYGTEMRTGSWWNSLKGRDSFDDLGSDGKIILKWILLKYDKRFSLSRRGTSDWLF